MCAAVASSAFWSRCHVMERESFESEEIAKILNDKFVSIKVDREERADVDRVYVIVPSSATTYSLLSVSLSGCCGFLRN